MLASFSNKSNVLTGAVRFPIKKTAFSELMVPLHAMQLSLWTERNLHLGNTSNRWNFSKKLCFSIILLLLLN